MYDTSCCTYCRTHVDTVVPNCCTVPTYLLRRNPRGYEKYIPGGRNSFSLASESSPSGYSKKRVFACTQLPTYDFFPQTMPDKHPPMPRPSRCPALITLPPFAKFQLVWRRLCEALPSSSLVTYILLYCLTYVGDIKVVLP